MQVQLFFFKLSDYFNSPILYLKITCQFLLYGAMGGKKWISYNIFLLFTNKKVNLQLTQDIETQFRKLSTNPTFGSRNIGIAKPAYCEAFLWIIFTAAKALKTNNIFEVFFSIQTELFLISNLASTHIVLLVSTLLPWRVKYFGRFWLNWTMWT